MSDLLSSAYDAFGHCSKCGSDDVVPSTEQYHVSGECCVGGMMPSDTNRERAFAKLSPEEREAVSRRW